MAEYGRFNPSATAKRYPYEYKQGKFGKVRRSNILGISVALTRKMKDNPKKWYKT